MIAPSVGAGVGRDHERQILPLTNDDLAQLVESSAPHSAPFWDARSRPFLGRSRLRICPVRSRKRRELRRGDRWGTRRIEFRNALGKRGFFGPNTVDPKAQGRDMGSPSEGVL